MESYWIPVSQVTGPIYGHWGIPLLEGFTQVLHLGPSWAHQIHTPFVRRELAAPPVAQDPKRLGLRRGRILGVH